jgi:hypothetical protein
VEVFEIFNSNNCAKIEKRLCTTDLDGKDGEINNKPVKSDQHRSVVVNLF